MIEEDKVSPLYGAGKVVRVFSRALLIASVIFLILSFATPNPANATRAFIAAFGGLVTSYLAGYLMGRFAPPEKISIGDVVHAPLALWEVIDIWSHDGQEMLSIKPVVEVVLTAKPLVVLHEHEGEEVDH